MTQHHNRYKNLILVLLIAISGACQAGVFVKRAAYLYQYGRLTPFHRILYVRIPGKWTMTGRAAIVPYQKRTTYRIDLPLENTVYTINKPLVYQAHQLAVYSEEEFLDADRAKYVLPMKMGDVKIYINQQKAVIDLTDEQGNHFQGNGSYPLIQGHPPLCEGCL